MCVFCGSMFGTLSLDVHQQKCQEREKFVQEVDVADNLGLKRIKVMHEQVQKEVDQLEEWKQDVKIYNQRAEWVKGLIDEMEVGEEVWVLDQKNVGKERVWNVERMERVLDDDLGEVGFKGKKGKKVVKERKKRRWRGDGLWEKMEWLMRNPLREE
eukprot:TRINITY_DN4822_c0_g2_i1.p2 TRINITY_DN4822_c0_g2~~TRINITY_DN4822_c0_g2_i1.p2  ORF type:complete len:156 (-),score=61.33 TRINITY_DN4822_c0_g2_i1:194-661(-)